MSDAVEPCGALVGGIAVFTWACVVMVYAWRIAKRIVDD